MSKKEWLVWKSGEPKKQISLDDLIDRKAPVKKPEPPPAEDPAKKEP